MMCRRKEVKEWEKIDPVGKPRKDDEDEDGDGGWAGLVWQWKRPAAREITEGGPEAVHSSG